MMAQNKADEIISLRIPSTTEGDDDGALATTTAAATTADTVKEGQQSYDPHEPIRGDESKNDATTISSDDDDDQGDGGIYNVVTSGEHNDIETNHSNAAADDEFDDDFACPCCWIEAFETASTFEAWFVIMFTWAFVGFLGFWVIAFVFVGNFWAQVLYLAVAPLLLVRALQPPANRRGLLYHETYTKLAFGVAFTIGAAALLVMVVLPPMIGGSIGIGFVLFAYLAVLPIALAPCLRRFRRSGNEPRSSGSCTVGGGTTGGGAAVADAPLYSTTALDEDPDCEGGG